MCKKRILGYGTTTHINTMQGCSWSQLLSDDERFIFVDDDNKVAIKVIGTFILLLKIEFYLDLFETFVVSSFRKNLISISNKFDFSCFFENNKVSFYQNSNVVDYGSLISNLYMLDVFSSHNEILQTSYESFNVKVELQLGNLERKLKSLSLIVVYRIVPQYTMVEQRNWTFEDMVRKMINHLLYHSHFRKKP
ncbi:hypothetical protein CR513_52673, partial [Mucuna pruriens]